MSDSHASGGLYAMRAVTTAALLGSIFLYLGYAPPMVADGQPLGEAFRIFYIHVPAAWVCFLALFVSFVSAIAVLVTRSRKWDILSVATAEVGWILATIVITTGPIWAKAAWGTYWTWEPRLTSFLVLWLLYLGYIILRGAIDDPEKRARFSAVLSIIAFLDVPIIFFAIKLWGAIGHPVPNLGFFRDPPIRNTLLGSIACYLIVTAYLVWKRCEVEAREV
jgi:heme exporter protein C